MRREGRGEEKRRERNGGGGNPRAKTLVIVLR